MAASRNKPLTDPLQRVADFVSTRLSPDEPVCVGLSGGCDSVVLLHLLSRLNLGARLQALHVHHGLSSNADDWANFSLQYSHRLGVNCSVVHVQVKQDDAQGLEAAARNARHAAFAGHGFRTVFLAHHAGDQAETLLFNLLRGAGLSGMAAMREDRQIESVRFLRPLLQVTRNTIESYARQAQLQWITDESNADTRFSRNFIRHEVLTAINRRFPAAESLLVQSAAHCAEADGLLGELAALDWDAVADGESINMRRLRAMTLNRLKNLLRYRLRYLGWRVPEASRLEEFSRQLLEAAPDRHPQLELPNGCMRVAGGCLHWLVRK